VPLQPAEAVERDAALELRVPAKQRREAM